MMVMPSGRRSSEPGPARDNQRHRAEHGRKRRHQDRPEAREARLVDGLHRRQTAPALALQREVHHHDAVLLDDADQEDDADEGDHRQLGAGHLQRQQRAEARPRAASR